MCSLSSAIAQEVLRAICHGPRADIDCFAGYALLALSQLPFVMELSVLHYGYLAVIIHRPIVLSQLDEPVPHVLADWRRSGCHSPT